MPTYFKQALPSLEVNSHVSTNLYDCLAALEYNSSNMMFCIHLQQPTTLYGGLRFNIIFAVP